MLIHIHVFLQSTPSVITIDKSTTLTSEEWKYIITILGTNMLFDMHFFYGAGYRAGRQKGLKNLQIWIKFAHLKAVLTS
jgi:hypothetical protein